MTKLMKKHADDLAKLHDDVSGLWLAPIFPMPDTTTEGIKRFATWAHGKAEAIMRAANAAGDVTTAKEAANLARSLVSYTRGDFPDPSGHL